MPLPPNLHMKYIARFDQLVADGEALLADVRQSREIGDDSDSGTFEDPETGYIDIVMDHDRFYKWRTNCVTLLSQIVSKRGVHKVKIDDFAKCEPAVDYLSEILGTIKAIKSDYEEGFLNDLSLLIRAEIASDYMGQAETLLAEGYHIAAVVLAGAVLEDALRKLCEQNNISIEKTIGGGKTKRKTMNDLNTDLYKQHIYMVGKMQEIQSWATHRNHAAHGEADKVRLADAQPMVKGIRNFIADYLK